MSQILTTKSIRKVVAVFAATLMTFSFVVSTNQTAMAVSYQPCVTGYTDTGSGTCEKVYDAAAALDNPNFSMPAGITSVDILVVGGGGGAGGIAGNNLIGMTTGAGGGQMILCLNQALDPNSLYDVQVGAGGQGSIHLASLGMAGTDGGSSHLGSCSANGGFGSAGSDNTVEPTWGGASGSGYSGLDRLTYGLQASGYIFGKGVIGAGGFGGSYKTQQHAVLTSKGVSWWTGLPFQPASTPISCGTCYFAGDGAFGESPAAQTPANPGLFATDVNWYGGGGGGGVTTLGSSAYAPYFYAGRGGSGGGGQAGNINGYYKTNADADWATATGQPGTNGLGGGAGGTSTVGNGDSAGGADGGDGVVKIRYKAPVAVPPTITGIGPTTGSASGGTTITINGSGFTSSNMANLSFGGVACTPTIFVSSTQVTCTTGAHAVGNTTLELDGAQVTGPFTYTYATVVTFNLNGGGGTAPASLAIPVATMPGISSMIAPAGSGFAGTWSCTPSGGSAATVSAGAAYNPVLDTNCLANWTGYSIAFGLNGGTGTAPGNQSGVITMPDGTGMTPPAGKFFDGWTCTPGGAIAAGAQFTPTAASSCLPVWTGFAVNFDTGTGGGAAPTSTTGVTVLPGQGSMTAPTGTAFGGWNCTPPSPAVHYSAGASFTPTATSQCSAQWDVIHVVNFATGSGAGTAPVSQNSPIASMPLQGGMNAPAGFGFGGWSCFDGTNTLSVAAGAPYSPAADATCTAQWTAFTVTFTSGSGSGTAPTGGPGVIPAMPDGTGMTGANGSTFNGWLCTPGGLVAAGAAFTPSANSTCVAQWLPLATPAPQKKLVVVMVNNSTIVEGKSLPTFTTNVDSDLSSLSCSVYSRSDKNYSSSLAANQLTAANSPYVIHCSYVAKDGIEVVAYSDGVLNVDQARTPGAGSGNGGGTGTASAGTHKLVAKYYFNGDSPKLRAATIAGLKKLAKKVGAKVNVVVAVQGFVKRTKVTSYDYRLSLDRALNIVAYLKKLGVKASFSADSRGIATENNAKARRAEVTITW